MTTIRTMSDKGRSAPIQSHLLVCHAGTETYTLHLHRDGGDRREEWVVSDPVSGMKVCFVHDWYKGLKLSSRSLNKPRAFPLAVAQVEALIERVGSEKFNNVLAAGRAKAKKLDEVAAVGAP